MQNGIYNLTRSEYNAVPALNWSTLRHARRSLAHFLAAEQTPPEYDGDGPKLGRATHTAMLEPERFRATVAIWEGGRRYGKEWDAFCAKHKGRELLLPDEYQQCIGMQAAVRAHPIASKYLQKGQREIAVIWKDTETGILLKTLIDFLGEQIIADLKTGRDVSPASFSRTNWNLGYFAQAAVHVDAINAVTGQIKAYKHIAVDSEAPHNVVVYNLPPSMIARGRREYSELLRRVAQCRATGNYPGYAEEEVDLEFPSWAAANTDDEADPTGLGLVINQ